MAEEKSTETKKGPQSKAGRRLVKKGAEYLGYMVVHGGKRVEYYHAPAELYDTAPGMEQVAVRVLKEVETVCGMRFDERLIRNLSK